MADNDSNRPPNLIPPFNRRKLSASHLTKLGKAINRGNSGVDPPYQVLPPVVATDTGQTLAGLCITIDGNGAVIAAGMNLGGATVQVQMACKVTKWTVEGDASGSIAVDVQRAAGGVPSASIVGSGNKPALSSQQYATAAPTGRTSVALAAGDIIGFAISGTPTTVKRVTVTLQVAIP